MKKAFTMIELVFVIVIIGILAGIAVPRLAATRDDAEVTRTLENIRIAVSDIASFGLSGKDIAGTGIDKMTRISFLLDGAGSANEKAAYITSKKNVKCVKFTVARANASDGWEIKSGDWYLEVTNETSGANDSMCKKIQNAVSDTVSKRGKIKMRGSTIFDE